MCYYYDISSISTDPISIIFNRQISGLQTNDIANISSSSSSYWYWNGENYGFHKQLTADDVVKYISTNCSYKYSLLHSFHNKASYK